MTAVTRWMFFFVTALLLTSAPIAWAAPVGRVTLVEGEAEILRGGKTPGVKATVNDAVNEGDVLRTKRQARIEARMTDGSSLALNELTQLEVKKYTAGANPDAFIDATQGQLRVIVSDVFAKRKESFRVKTPTAIVGVQGTEFVLQIAIGITRVFLTHGSLSVRNALPDIAGIRILSPGQTTRVESGRPPAPPEKRNAPTRDVGKTSDKTDKTKSEKSERSLKTDKTEKPVRTEKLDKIDKTDKIDKVDKVEKVEKVDKVDKVEKVEKVERVEKVEKVERIEKPEKVEKVERIEKPVVIEKLESVYRK